MNHAYDNRAFPPTTASPIHTAAATDCYIQKTLSGRHKTMVKQDSDQKQCRQAEHTAQFTTSQPRNYAQHHADISFRSKSA